MIVWVDCLFLVLIVMKIRIATRESRLALWQAQHVQQCLLALPHVSEVELVGMTTQGDQILDRSLAKIGGKGLFIKELEDALLQGRADVAVHSGKDIPVDLASEFQVLGFMTREDPRDALVSNQVTCLSELPHGAVVGSSSLRRQAQVLARYPHLCVQPLRGNLDTRLRKLDEGQYHAIVLAAAGLKRLGLQQRIAAYIEPEAMLPAVAQGALGLEILASRQDLLPVLTPLIDRNCTALVAAERAVSKALGGSCQVPLAAHACLVQGSQALYLRLCGLVASPCGQQVLQHQAQAQVDDSTMHAVGQELAHGVVQGLVAQGARALLP